MNNKYNDFYQISKTKMNKIDEKVMKEIKKLKKRLQQNADEFWKIDQENGVLGHGNTFEVGIASGIEEAIWHIEQFEEKLSKVE